MKRGRGDRGPERTVTGITATGAPVFGPASTEPEVRAARTGALSPARTVQKFFTISPKIDNHFAVDLEGDVLSQIDTAMRTTSEKMAEETARQQRLLEAAEGLA